MRSRLLYRPASGWPGSLALGVLLAVITGCSSGRPPEVAPTIDADRLLFERGTEALDEGDWLRSREYFTQIRDNYPQSDFRDEARLAIGDTYEGQGTIEAYVSAIAEYQDFLSLFPTHARAPYAQYKLGMVYFHQMKGPERDQSNTREAIREFEAFIQRYPNSDLLPEVRTRLREARDRLSASEFVVGTYYYRNKWWPGAIDRLQSILDDDPAYSGRDAVYFYLADSFRRAGVTDQALPLFERLVSEFPESEYIEETNEILPDVRAALAARADAEPPDASPDTSTSAENRPDSPAGR